MPKNKKKSKKTFWDAEKLTHMRDQILPKSRTIQEALRKASEKWNRKFDRAHFTVTFKRHFGFPPKQYVGVKVGPAENPYPNLPPNLNPTILLQKNRELEKEIEKLNKHAAESLSMRHLIEELVCGVVEHKIKPPTWLSDPVKVGEIFHGAPTLGLGDIHFGEIISSDQSLSGLPYNAAIAKRRIERTILKTCELMSSRVLAQSTYPGIILALLGDLFSGYIHQELRENAEMPLFVAVTELLDVMVAAIDTLRREFGKVYIPCVVGNHSRLDPKPRSKNAVYDNVEWIFYYMLRRHYRTLGIDDVRVDISVTEEHRYRVYNTRMLITHGAEFKGGNGITGPLLPWTRGFQKKQQQAAAAERWAKKKLTFDIMFMAHWHQYFHGDDIIVNGPIVEMGEYARRMQFPYKPSCSALFTTHPKRGIRIKLPVYAEPSPEEGKETPAWVSVFDENPK